MSEIALPAVSSYEELLAAHLGLHDSQMLFPADRLSLMVSMMSDGEFEALPRRATSQIGYRHRELATRGLPPAIYLVDCFIDRYHQYDPPSGDFSQSIIMSEAKPRFDALPDNLHQQAQAWTARAAIEMMAYDAGFRWQMSCSPARIYRREAQRYIRISDQNFPIEGGEILDFDPGIRGGLRRMAELAQGLITRVVQLNTHTFPGEMTEQLRHHNKVTEPRYQQSDDGIAKGTDRLLSKQKDTFKGFAATIMADSIHPPTIDDAEVAIQNAADLSQDGGILVIRERTHTSRDEYGADSLIDLARTYFDTQLQNTPVRITRGNQEYPGRLAVFARG